MGLAERAIWQGALNRKIGDRQPFFAPDGCSIFRLLRGAKKGVCPRFLSRLRNKICYDGQDWSIIKALRRSGAILLLTFFSFSLIGPEAFVDSDSTLPACCRRGGKHHCASMEQAHRQPASAPAIKAVRQCASFPKADGVRAFSNSILVNASQSFFASIVSHPVVQPQTEARQRVSFSRSRQKRGPPISLS